MKKYSKETMVGIFVIIGLLCIAYMAVNLGNMGFIGENTYSLYGKFNTVSGLRVGNPVNMLGLEIGRVEKFTMDQENQVVQVEFKINKGVEVYDDAIASVKTEGLIGDKFVEIDAGGGGDLLADGDTITDTNSPTSIMDMISKYAFGDVGGGEEKVGLAAGGQAGVTKALELLRLELERDMGLLGCRNISEIGNKHIA